MAISGESIRLAIQVFMDSLVTESLRYAFFGILLWGMIHCLLKTRLQNRIIAGWPNESDFKREIIYSISTLFIFSGIGILIVAMLFSGQAVIYHKIERYSIAWFLLSLPFLIILHDAYFYWTHRLLHLPGIYSRFHHTHHRSRQPSPWTAYSFHPVEALVHAGFVPLMLFFIPIHVAILAIFSLHQVIRNLHFHLSIETMPCGFAKHWFWGRFTTSTHHHIHHEYSRDNYGLWFTWWDRICKTEHPEYLARFEKVTVNSTKNSKSDQSRVDPSQAKY